MNAAGQCETLFSQVDDLGAGIAAIGDLLQFGKDDAYPETLNGVGIVLRQLGASMRNLNGQFLGGAYQGIRELERKDEQAIVAKLAVEKITQRQNATSIPDNLTQEETIAALARLLDEAVDVNRVSHAPPARAALRIVPALER
ncbi:MAG: hypothetical protein HYZ65_04175 [Burkholderiales bacterium]|nr:hypothetical protein [Burkholderiales bacterium]